MKANHDYNYLILPVLIATSVVACHTGSNRQGLVSHSTNNFSTHENKRYCQYAYVNHSLSNNIKSFGVNMRNGDLESLDFPLVPTGNNPGSFYTHPNGKYVYVLAGNDNTIMTYEIIHNSGQLIHKDTDISPGFAPWGGSLTPKTGKYFYVCNNASNNITMYKVDPESGTLTLNITTSHPNGLVSNAYNGIGPNSIKITSNLKFVYVGNYYSNNITIYHYDDNTGDLTLAEPQAINIAYCLNPRQIILSPAAIPSNPTYVPPARQLYVLCQSSNNIVQFNLDDEQLLIPESHPHIVRTMGVSPTSMSIESEYKYLYVPNMMSNTVTQFTMESGTGFLTTLNTPVIKGGLQGKGIYTNMGYAYVTNFADNTISKFKIESNGTLTKIGKNVPTGGVAPGNITFTPVSESCSAALLHDHKITTLSAAKYSVNN